MKTFYEVKYYLDNHSFKRTSTISPNRPYVYDAYNSQYLYDFQDLGYIKSLLQILPYTNLVEGIDYSDEFDGYSYKLSLITLPALSFQLMYDTYIFKNGVFDLSFLSGISYYLKFNTGFFFNSLSNKTNWNNVITGNTAFGYQGGNKIGTYNGGEYWESAGTGGVGSDGGFLTNPPGGFFDSTYDFTIISASHGLGCVHAFQYSSGAPYNPQTVFYNRTDIGLYMRVIDASGHQCVLTQPYFTDYQIVGMQWNGTSKVLSSLFRGSIHSVPAGTFTSPLWHPSTGRSWGGGIQGNFGITDGIFELIVFNSVIPNFIFDIVGKSMHARIGINYKPLVYNPYIS